MKFKSEKSYMSDFLVIYFHPKRDCVQRSVVPMIISFFSIIYKSSTSSTNAERHQLA